MTDGADTPLREGGREGSLDAPFRREIAWRDEDYYDLAKVHAEMERVFDICHGCRRCFNLCDSFPRLFDAIDEGPTGEIDGIGLKDFAHVAEACTLCDMCFLTKCPYVPPHPFDLDFPHLILRYRAAKRRAGEKEWVREQLGETDRNGKLAKPVAGLANWATAKENTPLRKLMEGIAGVDAEAELPKYHARTAADRLKRDLPAPDPNGPAFGKRRVALYATCFVEYNQPDTAVAAARVLALQGVEVRLVYPKCCSMPELEAGALAEVAAAAERVAKVFDPLIEQGFEVVALTASCGLMLKFEWPLMLPENHAVGRLAAATRDIGEYVVGLSKAYGLAEGLKPVQGGMTVHHACHARAQNMGAKSAEMLRLIPDTTVNLVERCSGHGGTFGVMKKTHAVARKVGRAAARQIAQKAADTLCSDCPLACKHLGQMLAAETVADAALTPVQAHPIEVVARAYGVLDMPAQARKVTPADLIPDADYARERKSRRAALLPIKRLRRVELGPFCTAYFECYETMLFQIQEMLLTEKGGAEQVPDELAAYNPLIPQGAELVATVMFEIDDPARREKTLARLGEIEDRFFLQIGDTRAAGVPEGDVERTREDGKTSSVHFLRFALAPGQVAAFRDLDIAVHLGCDHPAFSHLAGLSPETRVELSRDLA